MNLIFVVAACTAGKGTVHVVNFASFVVKIFVVHCHKNLPPGNYQYTEMKQITLKISQHKKHGIWYNILLRTVTRKIILSVCDIHVHQLTSDFLGRYIGRILLPPTYEES